MRPRGSPKKLAKAREMRKKPTGAEGRVWQLLRGRQVHGLKFRRQAVIAGFIVDFYCAERKPILEVDGSVHENLEIHEYDLARDEILTKLGYEIIRIGNDMAMSSTIDRIVGARLGSSVMSLKFLEQQPQQFTAKAQRTRRAAKNSR